MVGFTVTFSCLKRKKGEKGIRKKKKKKEKIKSNQMKRCTGQQDLGGGVVGGQGGRCRSFCPSGIRACQCIVTSLEAP